MYDALSVHMLQGFGNLSYHILRLLLLELPDLQTLKDAWQVSPLDKFCDNEDVAVLQELFDDPKHIFVTMANL